MYDHFYRYTEKLQVERVIGCVTTDNTSADFQEIPWYVKYFT